MRHNRELAFGHSLPDKLPLALPTVRLVPGSPGGRAALFRKHAMGRLTALPGRLSRLPGRVAAMPKVAEGFYTSRAWREWRAERMLDADYFAALRRAKKDGSKRVILDHVVERRDGGADLDPANTQWLTHAEHQAKTAEAWAARARGGRG